MDLYFDDQHIENYDIHEISLSNHGFSEEDLDKWRIYVKYTDMAYFPVTQHRDFLINYVETKDGDLYFYSKEGLRIKELRELEDKEQLRKRAQNMEYVAILKSLAAPFKYKLFINDESKGIVREASLVSNTSIRIEYLDKGKLLAETVKPITFRAELDDKYISIDTI